MSKRILVSVACIALVVHIGYTFSDSLMANDEQSAPVAEAPRSVILRRPEPLRYDASSDWVPPSIPTPTENPPAADEYPNATYGGQDGRYPDATTANRAPASQVQQTPEPSPEVSAVVPVPINPGSPPVPYHGTVVDSPWSSPPGSPKQVGTYTVVSDGKRSILLNTSKGDSWQLIIDNPGSHWQPIAMGVPKGGKASVAGEQTSNLPCDDEAAAAFVDAHHPDFKRAIKYFLQEMHSLEVRRDTLEKESYTNALRIAALEKQLVEANGRVSQPIVDKLNAAFDEIAFLKRQLAEAKHTLDSRPQPAAPKKPDVDESSNEN